MIDGRVIAESPTEAHLPVTTAVYTVVIVMNEDDVGSYRDEAARDMHLRKDLADEFQRALDDGYFMHLRYDALDFEVVSRVPVTTQGLKGMKG